MARGRLPAQPAAGQITTAMASRLLLCTDQWLRQLSRAGHFPKAVNGNYELVPLIQGFLRYLRDEATKPESPSESRLRAAKAEMLEARNERLEATLVDREDCEAIAADIIRTYRREFAGLGGKATADAETAAKLDGVVEAAIARAEASFASAFAKLKAGKERHDGP